MAYILTDKLSAAINSNAILVDDDEAKYEYLDTEVKFYLESELAILIKALKEDLSVTDVNTVDASSIVLDDTIKADILDSVLLFDAVSKIIIDNNTLVKPTISLRKNSYNVQKIVDDEQMTYLLNVLIKLGVSNMSAGITVNLSSDVNENISLSYILRATVSDKVLDNSEIKVATANIDSGITDYSVIKETEMLAMLNAISEGLGLNNVSGITSTISLPGKNDLDLDNKIAAISASQIIRATITKKLDFKVLGKLPIVSANATKVDNGEIESVNIPEFESITLEVEKGVK